MSLNDSFCQKKIDSIFYKIKESHQFTDKLLINDVLRGHSQEELDEKWRSLPANTRQGFREVVNELEDVQETYSLLIGDFLNCKSQIIHEKTSLFEEEE